MRVGGVPLDLDLDLDPDRPHNLHLLVCTSVQEYTHEGGDGAHNPNLLLLV